VYIQAVTIHARVLEAARRLCREGGGWTFRSQAVVAALADLNPGSVRTHVMSRCCVNAPSNHPHRWPYFRRVRRGVYQVQPAWRAGAGVEREAGDATRANAVRRSIADTRPVTARDPVVTVRESAAGYAADIPGMPGTVRAASLDAIVDRARRAGQGKALLLRLELSAEHPDPVVAVYMRDIDRTLIRQSLRMTHEERLGTLQDWLNAMDEARGSAGRRVAGGGAAGRGPAARKRPRSAS
jgi:hypothetical protein